MKHFGMDLMKTVKQSDWLDWMYLSYMVGAGVLAAEVADLLMKEFP